MPSPSPSVAARITSSASAPILAEEMHAEFAKFATIAEKACCAVLLDPALRDAADDPAFAPSMAGQSFALSNETMYPRIGWEHPNLCPAHRPYLVPLQMMQLSASNTFRTTFEMSLADQQLESLIQGNGNRICGWIFYARPIEELASHLGSLAVQRLPSDRMPFAGKRVLLRYFDPNVMPALWELSNASQRRILLGPITRLTMLSRAGELQPYQVAEGDSADARASIDYSEKQWRDIENIGALNQVAMSWQAESLDDYSITPDELKTIAQALKRAMGYGFIDHADKKAFAYRALTVHPHFDQHPKVTLALKCITADAPRLFTRTIAGLKDSDWRQIRNDLVSGHVPFNPKPPVNLPR